MNCKDCKYWSAYIEGICDREGDLHTERTPTSSFYIEANASDDTRLSAYLFTGPMFGCVQFEGKTL